MKKKLNKQDVTCTFHKWNVIATWKDDIENHNTGEVVWEMQKQKEKQK